MSALVGRSRHFEALKVIRGLLPVEAVLTGRPHEADVRIKPAPVPPIVLAQARLTRARPRGAAQAPRRSRGLSRTRTSNGKHPMTSVTPTTGTGASSSTTTAPATTASTAAAAQLNFNSFLQLMIAEMKNQDPTSPTDPSQYLGQISQMSAVQQGILTNTKLDSMLTQSSLSQAEGAIGKVVTSADGATSGTVQSVKLASDGSVTATLGTGSTLKLDNTVTIGASSAGSATS